jgi:SOS response associated peptidase (SRAP)
MFRSAFENSRCLIPASGYYEWQNTPEGKQPYYFTRRDGKPITIAGLWDRWHEKPGGNVIQSCAMDITEPNEFVADIHDRMPVILEVEKFEREEARDIEAMEFDVKVGFIKLTKAILVRTNWQARQTPHSAGRRSGGPSGGSCRDASN